MWINKSALIRDNKWNIIWLIIFIVAAFLVYKLNIITSSDMVKSDHFNILTINSIFAGFLFTGLGIMISGTDKPRLKRLEDGGYLQKYYCAIYIAITFNLTTIIIATLLWFNVDLGEAKKLFVYIEKFVTLGGIFFFIKCMNNLRKLIYKMRND